MKKNFLLYISLACSIGGLILLYYISQVVELSQTSINQITIDDIGKNVRVCGEITSKTVSKTQHVFLKLEDGTGNIDIVAFNNSAEKFGAYGIEKSDKVCITGQVDEYQNKLEIILKEEIKRVSNVY